MVRDKIVLATVSTTAEDIVIWDDKPTLIVLLSISCTVDGDVGHVNDKIDVS